MYCLLVISLLLVTVFNVSGQGNLVSVHSSCDVDKFPEARGLFLQEGKIFAVFSDKDITQLVQNFKTNQFDRIPFTFYNTSYFFPKESNLFGSDRKTRLTGSNSRLRFIDYDEKTITLFARYSDAKYYRSISRTFHESYMLLAGEIIQEIHQINNDHDLVYVTNGSSTAKVILFKRNDTELRYQRLSHLSNFDVKLIPTAVLPLNLTSSETVFLTSTGPFYSLFEDGTSLQQTNSIERTAGGTKIWNLMISWRDCPVDPCYDLRPDAVYLKTDEQDTINFCRNSICHALKLSFDRNTMNLVSKHPPTRIIVDEPVDAAMTLTDKDVETVIFFSNQTVIYTNNGETIGYQRLSEVIPESDGRVNAADLLSRNASEPGVCFESQVIILEKTGKTTMRGEFRVFVEDHKYLESIDEIVRLTSTWNVYFVFKNNKIGVIHGNILTKNPIDYFTKETVNLSNFFNPLNTEQECRTMIDKQAFKSYLSINSYDQFTAYLTSKSILKQVEVYNEAFDPSKHPSPPTSPPITTEPTVTHTLRPSNYSIGLIAIIAIIVVLVALVITIVIAVMMLRKKRKKRSAPITGHKKVTVQFSADSSTTMSSTNNNPLSITMEPASAETLSSIDSSVQAKL